MREKYLTCKCPQQPELRLDPCPPQVPVAGTRRLVSSPAATQDGTLMWEAGTLNSHFISVPNSCLHNVNFMNTLSFLVKILILA